MGSLKLNNKRGLLAVAMALAMVFAGAVFVADEADATESDSEVTYLAQIGENKYETLIDAIKDVENGQTIVLLDDVEDAHAIGVYKKGTGFGTSYGGAADMKIVEGEGFTIDLNGKTYNIVTMEGSEGTVSQALHLERGFSLTIKNGTLSCGANVTCMMMNYCELTLDGVSIPSLTLNPESSR